MKQEIIEYLSGPRDYSEGVELYRRYGLNLRLKRLFAIDDTQTTREILADELRKLAGLTEGEFATLPRRAANYIRPRRAAAGTDLERGQGFPKPDEDRLQELADSFGVTVDELVSPDFQERVLAMDENADRVEELTGKLEEARSKYATAPDPVRKMIRFREKYPFLNAPDCPDALKILVADMFTSYDNYKAAYARLQAFGDDDSAEAAAECEKVVTEYLKNREIWDELEYYRENGTMLGKAAKIREMEETEDFTALSEMELMKQLQSAAAQASKHKKAAAIAREAGKANEKAEAAYERWSERKQALQEEVARRKKK